MLVLKGKYVFGLSLSVLVINFPTTLLLSFIYVRHFRYVIMFVTFISIHLVIICVVFCAHMRRTRVYPLNPGVTHDLLVIAFTAFFHTLYSKSVGVYSIHMRGLSIGS
jgi:hydrogenase-4 membrane subunit HyfE